MRRLMQRRRGFDPERCRTARLPRPQPFPPRPVMPWIKGLSAIMKRRRHAKKPARPQCCLKLFCNARPSPDSEPAVAIVCQLQQVRSCEPGATIGTRATGTGAGRWSTVSDRLHAPVRQTSSASDCTEFGRRQRLSRFDFILWSQARTSSLPALCNASRRMMDSAGRLRNYQ